MCKSSSLPKELCCKDCTKLQAERHLLRAALTRASDNAAFSRALVWHGRYFGSAALSVSQASRDSSCKTSGDAPVAVCDAVACRPCAADRRAYKQQSRHAHPINRALTKAPTLHRMHEGC